MQRIILALAFTSFSSLALARPGFYVGLAGGGASVSGESGIGASRFGPDEQGIVFTSSITYSTHVGGGGAAAIFGGFNVLGYGALELCASAHGSGLFDVDTREAGWQLHFGLRAYPLWHWQARLPEYLHALEPSLFVGWGARWAVYTPVPGGDPVGWSKMPEVVPSRFGLGLEYFLIDYFRVGLDYAYVRAPYDNFIFNYEESLNFPASPPASTRIHQVFATVAFQFGPEQKVVRYTR